MRPIPEWAIQASWSISGVFATGAVWYFLSVKSYWSAGLSALGAATFAVLAVVLHRRKDAFIQRSDDGSRHGYVNRPTDFSGGVEAALEKAPQQQEGANIARTPSVIAAYRLAIVHLLGMQYPWGEWSDRRTAMESSIAERRSFRGPEGPKPNVARTLFAIEALRRVPTQDGRRSLEQALDWISRGVSNGWYLEWTTQQVLDSEDHLPPLVLRKDVRHTAQVATVLAMWKPSAEPLGSLVVSVAKSQLVGGLWPEGPEENSPRVLARLMSQEVV